MKGEEGDPVLIIKPWPIDGVTACDATVPTGARVSERWGLGVGGAMGVRYGGGAEGEGEGRGVGTRAAQGVWQQCTQEKV